MIGDCSLSLLCVKAKNEVDGSKASGGKVSPCLLVPLCIYLLYVFRCTNGDFYVALGSSMGLALLV